MVHHADHGSQYVSIAYNERLAEYGIIASTGTVGDSYDNALAENVNGSYKNELIHTRTWNDVVDVEIATFEWVTWWNESRLHQSLGYRTPTEVETKFWEHNPDHGIGKQGTCLGTKTGALHSYPSSHSFHLKCLKWKSSIMVALPKLGIIFILSEGSLCRCKHQP